MSGGLNSMVLSKWDYDFLRLFFLRPDTEPNQLENQKLGGSLWNMINYWSSFFPKALAMMIRVIIGGGSNHIVGVVNSSFPRIILEAVLTNA